MNRIINNPFDITKAVDYTDDEIYRYWVDINKEQGFSGLMKPDSLMPMIIEGSKGSGKTHIMKYFSYELQKIRNQRGNKNFDDKFIGVYIRCSGFNSDKFSGKNVSDDVWANIYAYYWELWIGERITSIVLDLKDNGFLENFDEENFTQEVLNIFLTNTSVGIKTLTDLKEYFIRLQKEVEYESQNFIFNNKTLPKVDILIPVAKLSYKYPELLKNKIPFFRDKYIIYLIDELENFSEPQQQLVQTLLREKPTSCTYRVGTRPYGIRTYKTLKGIEENHDGSEFELVVLDEFLRASENYNKYVTQICERRLTINGISLCDGLTLENLVEDQTNEETIHKVYTKKARQSKSYFIKLKRNLTSLKNRSLTDENIDCIINNLTFNDDHVIERTNVTLFYRCIKDKKTNLLKESEAIKDSAYLYFQNKSDSTTSHYKYLDKYRQDIVDTIAREGLVDIPYFGLEKLIELSCGTPRTILRLLKAAFNTQYFTTGKAPFYNGKKLSVKSQKIAIESTYEWFFEENRIPSFGDNSPIDAVTRLGNFLQSLRFSDLPPQCSISIFSVEKELLSSEARRVLDILERYSYIVRCSDRRKKNSDVKSQVFVLNSILLPKWELALSKRGLTVLTVHEAELIFNSNNKSEFEKYLKNKLKQYSFPFFNAGQQLSLF